VSTVSIFLFAKKEDMEKFTCLIAGWVRVAKLFGVKKNPDVVMFTGILYFSDISR
jgi:hypothetical protein